MKLLPTTTLQELADYYRTKEPGCDLALQMTPGDELGEVNMLLSDATIRALHRNITDPDGRSDARVYPYAHELLAVAAAVAVRDYEDRINEVIAEVESLDPHARAVVTSRFNRAEEPFTLQAESETLGQTIRRLAHENGIHIDADGKASYIPNPEP